MLVKMSKRFHRVSFGILSFSHVVRVAKLTIKVGERDGTTQREGLGPVHLFILITIGFLVLQVIKT